MSVAPLPTRLNVRTMRAMRADALHRLLLTLRGTVTTLDDIGRLPNLSGWPTLRLETAIADLCHDRLLTNDGHGHVIVHQRPACPTEKHA